MTGAALPGPEGIAAALGAIPSGLFIVTCGKGDEGTGFLASFVQQVGFEPPTLTVAVRAGRGILDTIRASKAFCVNVLVQADKKHLAHFAKGVPQDGPPFEGIDVAPGAATGVPVLTGTLAQIECEFVGESEVWSDHVLVCGRVVGGHRGIGEPMVHIRKNGLSY